MPVNSFGKLTFTIPALPVVIECKVLNAENIWNEVATGKDEVEGIGLGCTSPQCVPVAVTAKKLAWATELAAGIDKIKGIELEVKCGIPVFAFTGELAPKIVNPTEGEPLTAEFTAATGELVEPLVPLKAKVEGKLRFVGFEHGETIKAE